MAWNNRTFDCALYVSTRYVILLFVKWKGAGDDDGCDRVNGSMAITTFQFAGSIGNIYKTYISWKVSDGLVHSIPGGQCLYNLRILLTVKLVLRMSLTSWSKSIGFLFFKFVGLFM